MLSAAGKRLLTALILGTQQGKIIQKLVKMLYKTASAPIYLCKQMECAARRSGSFHRHG